MISAKIFDFADILCETRKLKADLVRTLEQIDDEKVVALSKDVSEVSVSGPASDSPPLSIAFVGQYDAGKSTILTALTGRSDIIIDSDVCTDRITAYDWNGIRLLDTPGIHAGYPDHDEITYTAIDRADLLVFVITSELFDDTIGKHFRELSFSRKRAREILLVVNKMGLDPGTPELKKKDIEKVTHPLSCGDFRTIFIDALSFLEASGALDEEEKRELLEIANIDALIDELNKFVLDLGLTGRLTAPLFIIRASAEQAYALLSVDLPEERAALELLHRKRNLFLTSRARLRLAMNGIVNRAISDITRFGDEVAESVEPGKSEADVERMHQDAQRKASNRSEELSDEARKCVESEIEELRCQLEALRNCLLARELRGRVESIGESEHSDIMTDVATAPEWDVKPATRELADWPGKAKKIGNISDNIGKWAAKWATGPAAEGASVGSATAARGSQAHKVVYNVGKFFGVEFKPWGAVKVARAIGNVGRVIAVVGGVLAVVAQIAEDKQQEKYHIQLRNARDTIRSAYRDSALAVQSILWSNFETFMSEFYDSELQSIDEISRGLVGQRNVRAETTNNIREIADRTISLIARVHHNLLPLNNIESE